MITVRSGPDHVAQLRSFFAVLLLPGRSEGRNEWGLAVAMLRRQAARRSILAFTSGPGQHLRWRAIRLGKDRHPEFYAFATEILPRIRSPSPYISSSVRRWRCISRKMR